MLNWSARSVAAVCLVALASPACSAGPEAATPDRAGASPGAAGSAEPEAGGWSSPESKSETKVLRPTRDHNSLARGSSTPADEALSRGDAAYRIGEYGAAKQAYAEARRLAPNDPAPLVGLVRVDLSAHDVPSAAGAAPDHPQALAAVAQLRQAIALDGRYAPAHLELGRTLLVLDQMDAALTALTTALSLDEQNPEAHSAMGVALLANERVPEAARALERAAELEPGVAERQENLGTALLMAGKLKEAVDRLGRASSLAPRNHRIRAKLGTAHLASGDADAAITQLQAAVAGAPQQASYRSNLGFAYQLKGDLDRAIFHCRGAVQRDPQLVGGWINLGNALARKGKLDEAREAYGKAKSIDPDNPSLADVLAELRQLEQQAGKPKR